MNLEALFNAVIVKPIEAEETQHGNIIVPDMGNEKNQTGEVISVTRTKHSYGGIC